MNFNHWCLTNQSSSKHEQRSPHISVFHCSSCAHGDKLSDFLSNARGRSKSDLLHSSFENECNRSEKKASPKYEHLDSHCLQCAWSSDESGSLHCKEFLKRLLKDHFGYDGYREGQLEAIQSLLSRQNTIAVLPTGAGKSTCFQIPLLALRKIYKVNAFCIVISPLISIMEDQEACLPKSLKGFVLSNSSVSANRILPKIAEGKISVLFLSPERLANDDELIYALQKVQDLLAFTVIDEAHCMSQWGFDFRPSFRIVRTRIASIYSVDFKHQMNWLALTATATCDVLSDLGSLMTNPVVIKVEKLRTNLQLHAHLPEILDSKAIKSSALTFCDDALTTRLFHMLCSAILNILEAKDSMPALLYINTHQRAEELATTLRLRLRSPELGPLRRAQGPNGRIPAIAVYHAGLTRKQRSQIQSDFVSGGIDIIVATIAFGMGLNKKDIRMIVHLSLPSSPEQYVQEIGRGGRDGIVCKCYSLVHPAFYYEARRHIVKSRWDFNSVLHVCTYVLVRDPADETPIDLVELQRKTHMSDCDIIALINIVERMCPEYIKLINKHNLLAQCKGKAREPLVHQTYHYAEISLRNKRKFPHRDIPNIIQQKNDRSAIDLYMQSESPLYIFLKKLDLKTKSYRIDIYSMMRQYGMTYESFCSELESIAKDEYLTIAYGCPSCIIHSIRSISTEALQRITKSIHRMLEQKLAQSLQKLNFMFNLMVLLADGIPSKEVHTILHDYFTIFPGQLQTNQKYPNIFQIPLSVRFTLSEQDRGVIVATIHAMHGVRSEWEIVKALYGVGPSFRENLLYGKFSHVYLYDLCDVVANILHRA